MTKHIHNKIAKNSTKLKIYKNKSQNLTKFNCKENYNISKTNPTRLLFWMHLSSRHNLNLKKPLN